MIRQSLSPQEMKSEVLNWAERIKVHVDQVHVRPMRNKWGSLSTNGRLSLNAELLDLEKPFRDYVIVHELLHFRIPNHGKLFKSLMNAFLPAWEHAEEQLKNKHASSGNVA